METENERIKYIVILLKFKRVNDSDREESKRGETIFKIVESKMKYTSKWLSVKTLIKLILIY